MESLVSELVNLIIYPTKKWDSSDSFYVYAFGLIV